MMIMELAWTLVNMEQFALGVKNLSMNSINRDPSINGVQNLMV